MSTVRLMMQGTTNDYEAFSEFAKRAATYVEEHEPGAIAYECFADENDGRVVWHEMYENADAFLTHVQNMTQTGMLDETMNLVDIERLTVLTRITDPRVREVATQFGAEQLHGLAGFTR